MSTKISLILITFLILAMGLVYYSCDSPVSGEPMYKGMIKGWVYDDSTHYPLSGVKVWADGIPDTLNTDANGMFNYTKISMPRGEFSYYLIFQKSGYADKSYYTYVKSDTETKIDSVYMKKVVKRLTK